MNPNLTSVSTQPTASEKEAHGKQRPSASRGADSTLFGPLETPAPRGAEADTGTGTPPCHHRVLQMSPEQELSNMQKTAPPSTRHEVQT